MRGPQELRRQQMHDRLRAIDRAKIHYLDADWENLAADVGVLACWAYGHPGMPRRLLGRFRARPWRCDRCGTWWVAELAESRTWDSVSWQWRWTRVYEDQSPWQEVADG